MKKLVMQKTYFAQILSLLLMIALPFLLAEKVEAAGFQQTEVRIDRMTASTFVSGMVCVKTPAADTAGTENDVQVVFPADFTVSTTLTDWAVSTTGIPAAATAWPGIAQATAANNGTHTVTFPSTALSTATLYCFLWTDSAAALQTGSAGVNKTGTVTTRTSGPATIDTAAYATAVVGAGADLIGVTATVAPTFSFALGANTDTFASALSTTAQLSNGVTATISTNAASGWVAWVKSANAALNSLSTGATLATTGSVDNATTALTGGNYGYLLDVTFTDGGGTGTVTQATGYGMEYDGNSTNTGGTLATTFQPIASSSGTTDGDTVTLKELARITAVQAAATDYADTLTVVAAGRF